LAKRSTIRLKQRLLAAAFVLLAPLCSGCRQGPWTLWQSYSAHFIDQQGRVIDPESDSRTTSEGQAYAMFFALVGNDRPRFDRVFEWTEDNLARGDFGTHLPACLWGRDKDGVWKTLDPNPAADADVWIAYTLIEAGRLWKQPGYTNLGTRMMAQIASREVAELPGFGPMLMPGPVGFAHNGSWTLNPSYLPVFIFERLASVDPAGPWQKIAGGIPPLIRLSSPKGYAMDWVNYVPGDGFYPAPKFPDKPADLPAGGDDAIRVYLWAGMLEEQDDARSDILNALPSMSGFLAEHDAPPEKVSDQGTPSDRLGTVGFSAAVLPYLRAVPGNGKALARQSIRMNSEKNPGTGMYGKPPDYYDQNLALFATGFLEGRFSFDRGGELKVDWMRP
jgi:endo-1,4-beta-D-glucanase Y